MVLAITLPPPPTAVTGWLVTAVLDCTLYTIRRMTCDDRWPAAGGGSVAVAMLATFVLALEMGAIELDGIADDDDDDGVGAAVATVFAPELDAGGESGSLLVPAVPMLCTLSRWRV